MLPGKRNTTSERERFEKHDRGWPAVDGAGARVPEERRAPAGAGMQGLPVQTVAVTLQPVAQTSEFVATIKVTTLGNHGAPSERFS